MTSNDSRICMMVAVSVMSCVVAPQWQYLPASPLAVLGDLVDDAQHRIADIERLLLQLRPVDVFHLADAGDLGGGLLRDHADGRLGTGQRRLEIHVALRPVLVGPDGPHLRIAEDVTEDEGVDGTGRHLGILLDVLALAGGVSRGPANVLGWERRLVGGHLRVTRLLRHARLSGTTVTSGRSPSWRWPPRWRK